MVLRAADHPVTPRSRFRAAMLSLGEGATLVGLSAAFWWHLTDVPPAEIELAVAHGRRVRPRPGVRLLHRERDAGDLRRERPRCPGRADPSEQDLILVSESRGLFLGMSLTKS